MDQDKGKKEPAEGSRETILADQEQTPHQQGGGITNRPLEREQEEQHEVPPRGRTKEEERAERPSDVGRTMGGGSLGHDQGDEEKRDTPLRNNATGSDRDPVMPRDDSTLKTKI